MPIKIAELTGLSRNPINRYLKGIRQSVAAYCEQTSPTSGQIEIDESFFDGRGATSEAIVFGLFKRDSKVFIETVPDCASKALLLCRPQTTGRICKHNNVHQWH